MQELATQRPKARRVAQAAASALFATLLGGCVYVPGTASPLEQYRERLAQQKAIDNAAELAALEQPKPLDDVSFDEKLREGDRARDNGDIPRAVVDYAEAYSIDPNDPRPRERIGFIQLTEDAQRAELIFTELTIDFPDSAVAHLGVGLSQMAQDRPREARSSLERSVDLDDDSAVAQYALSVVRELDGDSDGALDSAKRAYALAPKDSRIVANLGVSYMLRGEYGKAETLLRRAVLLSPRTAANHNNLGITLGLMKRYDEAFEAFAATGSEQGSHNNLGYVYFLNGEYAKAIDEYEIALLTEGDDDDAILANLIRAYEVMGDEDAPKPSPVAHAPNPGDSSAAAATMALAAEATPGAIEGTDPVLSSTAETVVPQPARPAMAAAAGTTAEGAQQ